MLEWPRIINIDWKQGKYPVCGSRVVGIIYATGDITEVKYKLAYRREGIFECDNIAHQPLIRACSCGYNQFGKKNTDGIDDMVKILKSKAESSLPMAVWVKIYLIQ